MPKDTRFDLLTPTEVEAEFGKKYFYRQRIYRLEKSQKLVAFNFRGQTCFMGHKVLDVCLKDLRAKLMLAFPHIQWDEAKIFYDNITGKRIIVDGLFGKSVVINTDQETEEDLIAKISHISEWLLAESSPVDDLVPPASIEAASATKKEVTVSPSPKGNLVLPEEIMWVQLTVNELEGVEVKSMVLVSLSSVANFIGIATDKLTDWVQRSTFRDHLLSIHPKKINGPGKPGPWERGPVRGNSTFLPFELLPELVVASKQSNLKHKYPAKADMLYNLARTTLEAVGLAVAGNKEEAAKQLAHVGQGLGLDVADQIIGIFKQYESRDYQVQTTKEFYSKVNRIGQDFAQVSGKLTFGITQESTSSWKAKGTANRLPARISNSSREVMRELSPANGVGMTFGEKDFTINTDLEQAISTGKQGKDFYSRLKRVGLLDDHN